MDSTATTIGMRKRKRNLEIPLDVTTEILLRLPAKSIVRFRLACKLWREQTLAPQFIETHLDLARKVRPPSILLIENELKEFTILSNSCFNHGFFLMPNDQEVRCLRFFLMPNEQVVWCHGSRNGIVCFSGKQEKSIHLFNPATGDDLRVPKDPNTKNDRVYFGFHPVTKEYSIVNVYEKEEGEKEEEEGIDEMSLGPISGCRVYTIGTTHRSSSCSWREINTVINDFHPVYHFDAAELNGTMYFVSDGYTISVVSFDLKDETFTQTPLPFTPTPHPDFEFEFLYPDIFELQGSVYLTNKIAGRFDMWRLDEYDNKRGWTLMYSILERDGMILSEPLCIHRDKILMAGHTIDRKVLCYLCVKHNFKYDGALNLYGSYTTYAHVESLVALPNQ